MTRLPPQVVYRLMLDLPSIAAAAAVPEVRLMGVNSAALHPCATPAPRKQLLLPQCSHLKIYLGWHPYPTPLPTSFSTYVLCAETIPFPSPTPLLASLPLTHLPCP